jgi:protein-tyrosine phosphatase
MESSMSDASSVLFVCLGNICRSPLAEGAMRAEAEKAGLDLVVDSAGTGHWHIGEPPDRRAQAVAHGHGVDISGLRARQVSADDFRRFTHIFALDPENLADLGAIRPRDATATLGLLMDLVPGREGTAVDDPYYGDAAGFERSWTDVRAAAHALVAMLKA